MIQAIGLPETGGNDPYIGSDPSMSPRLGTKVFDGAYLIARREVSPQSQQSLGIPTACDHDIEKGGIFFIHLHCTLSFLLVWYIAWRTPGYHTVRDLTLEDSQSCPRGTGLLNTMICGGHGKWMSRCSDLHCLQEGRRLAKTEREEPFSPGSMMCIIALGYALTSCYHALRSESRH